MEKQQYIEAGRITNTHGVAGEVKIEVWLDSPQFMKRFPRIYIDGRPLALRSALTQSPLGLLAPARGELFSPCPR